MPIALNRFFQILEDLTLLVIIAIQLSMQGIAILKLKRDTTSNVQLKKRK